jgi:hypothetical protein
MNQDEISDKIRNNEHLKSNISYMEKNKATNEFKERMSKYEYEKLRNKYFDFSNQADIKNKHVEELYISCSNFKKVKNPEVKSVRSSLFDEANFTREKQNMDNLNQNIFKTRKIQDLKINCYNSDYKYAEIDEFNRKLLKKSSKIGETCDKVYSYKETGISYKNLNSRKKIEKTNGNIRYYSR